MNSYYSVRYHHPSESFGLPAGRDHVFPGFFLTWLALSDRLSPVFVGLVGVEVIDALKARQLTGPQLLEAVDGIIEPTMLGDEDVRWFAQTYFSVVDGGRYLYDFCTTFGVSARHESDLYRVEDSWENYERIAIAIDRAFAATTKPRYTH